MFTEYIASVKWQFAKTMPTSPHWYTLRAKAPHLNDKFIELVLYIREHGYNKSFGKTKYRYLDIGEFSYWTMGSPIDQTILINRAYTDGRKVPREAMVNV
jgi:hypothetical protein